MECNAARSELTIVIGEDMPSPERTRRIHAMVDNLREPESEEEDEESTPTERSKVSLQQKSWLVVAGEPGLY